MIYYRVALRGNPLASWRWKSSPLTSLDGVLGWLHLYRCMPRELMQENQGLLSTAITVDQLWDRYRVSWIEVRRLEMELGAGSDHDCPYIWSLPPGSQALAWTKLRALRERGAFEW